MAGRKIPHRHIERKAYSLRDRDINEACLYFKEMRGFSAVQPTLVPNLAIKALSPTAKNSGGGKTREEVAQLEDEPQQIKLDFEPSAKRKPGQLLKLHVTAAELMSPKGAKFGWVDPPGVKSQEEADQLQEAIRQSYRSRPPVNIVRYELDNNGNPTSTVRDKIRFKALGKRISEEAGQIGQAAFRAAGGIIDDMGRMRCPPGTPNANQFTDETMSNCMAVGLGKLRGMFNRVRARIDAAAELGAEINKFGRALTPFERRQQSKFEATRDSVVATREHIRARAERFNAILKDIFGDIPENISLENANADVMEAIYNELIKNYMDEGMSEKEAADKAFAFLMGPQDVGGGVQEAGIFADVPNFKICRGSQMSGCSVMWDETKSFRENMQAVSAVYDAEIRKEIERHIDPTFLAKLTPEERETFLKNMRTRHHLAQRESLSTIAVWSRDYPDAAKLLNSVRALTGPNELNSTDGPGALATIEGATSAASMDGGKISLDVKFNHIQQALSHLIKPDDATRIVGTEDGGWYIVPDESFSEPQRMAEMLRVAEELSDAMVYAETVGYANENSAARLQAALGIEAVQGRARHIAYHELGHVLQYNAIQQKVLDVYEQEGMFVLSATGEILSSPPETWTNSQWQDVMSDVMHITNGYNFPPGGARTLERSLVNLFAGKYYQNELAKAEEELAAGKIGKSHKSLRQALMEGSTEIYAQLETGVLVGEVAIDSIRWMYPESQTYRRPDQIPANMPPGFGEPPGDIPPPDVPDIPVDPPTWPPPDVPTPTAPPTPDVDDTGKPKEVPVGFGDLAGHIWMDNETQWHPEDSSSIPLEQNDDEIRQFVDAAFGLGPDEGGPDPNDPLSGIRHKTDAYWKMSPEQLDARYEKLDAEYRRLRDKSATEPLTADEQARMWLAIKGMRQILDQNTTRSKMSDDKVADYNAKGYNPQPGKYMRRADSSLRPNQKGLRQSAINKRRARGYDDITEVDDDELAHWQREIADHTGDLTTGRDGFDSSNRQYVPGKVRDKVGAPDKGDKKKRRSPEYEPTTEELSSATLSSAPDLVGRRKIDEIAERNGPQHRAIAESDQPVELSKPWQTTSGLLADDTTEIRSAVDRSARARDAIREGAGTMSTPDQESVDALLENQMRDKIFPTLDGLESSVVEEEMTIVSAMELDEPLTMGSVIDHSSPVRGLLVDSDAGDALKLTSPERSQRVVIVAPKGTRAMHTKNGHDGATDGVLMPPGSLEMTGEMPDGTPILTPSKQKSKDEVLTDLIDKVEKIDAPLGSAAAEEKRILRDALIEERGKIPASSRSVRGRSADAAAATRNNKRVQTINDEMAQSGSNYFGTTPDTGSRRLESLRAKQERDQRIREITEQQSVLLSRFSDLQKQAESGEISQEYFELLDTVSPDVMNFLASDKALDEINNTLFRFHERFDDRPRIALTEDEYADFLVTGKLPNPTEVRPNSIGASLQRSFEDANGVTSDLPDAQRSHFGFLVHQTNEQQIQQYLDERIGEGFLTRSAEYFSGDSEMDQYAQHKRGGKVVELVLTPETAKRTAYTRGDVLDGKRQPTPMLSTNRNEVAAAHLANQQRGASEIESLSEMIEVAETTTSGSMMGLGSGRDGLPSMRSRTSPPTHGAVVGGEISTADVATTKVPINSLELAPLTAEEIGGRERIKQLLTDSNITGDLDDIIDKLLDGSLPENHPAARFKRAFLLQRQHKTAKLAVAQHRLDHGDSARLIVTNPYGVALESASALSDITGAPFGEDDGELMFMRLRYDMNVANIKSLVRRDEYGRIMNDEELRAEYMRGGKLPLAMAEVAERRRIQQTVGDDASIDDAVNSEIDADTRALADERIAAIGDDAISLSRIGKGGKTRIDTRKSRLIDAITWDDDKGELTVTWKNGRTETYSGVDPRHVLLIESTYKDDSDGSLKPLFISDAVKIARAGAKNVTVGGEHADEATLRTAEMDARRSVGLRSARVSSSVADVVLSDDKLAELDELGKRINADARRISDEIDARSAKPFDGPLLGRTSKREVTGPDGGVRSTTPIAKRQRRVDEVFDEVQRKGPGALHDADDDELAGLGISRTENIGIDDGQPVYQVNDNETAAALLALGYNVELGDGARAIETQRAVETLQKDLNAYLKLRDDLSPKERASYQINGCRMYVGGTNFFCSESIGTERLEMPQVSGRMQGDDTLAARAAKAGLVKTKWEAGKRNPDGTKVDLTPEEMAEFEALKARHPAKGKEIANPLSPEETARFYELVDWNDTEVDFVDEWVEQMREAYGREDIVTQIDGVNPSNYTASQIELQADKVGGMTNGVLENYNSFVAFAESQGIKRGSPEFMEMRSKFLKGELDGQIPLLDENGVPKIDKKTGKPKFAEAWWAKGSIITARDGYVVDGHHRWAAIRIVNEGLPPEEQLTINTRQVDLSIFEALNTAKAMMEHVGIKQAKLGEEDYFVPNADIPSITPDELGSVLTKYSDDLPDTVAELKKRGLYTPKGAIERAEGREESLLEGMRFYGITPPGGRVTNPEKGSVADIFERVQSRGPGGLHDVDADVLAELGVSRLETVGIADNKPVYEADTPEAAAALLALGYNVELGEGARAVETKLATASLQKELDNYLKQRSDFSEEERKSFVIDACKMYVGGTNFFCGENIGTERMDMPQVSGRTLGDTTVAARAAKAGLVKTKWEPGKRSADGQLTKLTPEELAEFESLKARHPAKGKTIENPLSPEEKARFYELVDWNDTEVDFVDEWVEHMREAYGRENIITERNGVSTNDYTASQSQIQAEKVAGMASGIRENYDAFVRHAELQGVKRGSPEFYSMRDKWLAGDLKVPMLDEDGNPIIDEKTGKPKFATAWWAQGHIITSRDGYVVDGHHRWAAVRLINASLPPDEELRINTREVDTSIFEALNTAKAMQEAVGIKQAKLGKEDFFQPDASVADMTPEELADILSQHTADLPSKVQDLKERGTYSPRGAIERVEGREESLAEGMRFYEGSRSSVSRDVRGDGAPDITDVTSRGRSMRSRRGDTAKPEPKSVEVFKKVREMGEDGLHDKSENELRQLGISRTETTSMADGQPVYRVDDVATAGALMALGYNVDLGDKARAKEVKKANKTLQKEINKYLEGLSDMTDKERAQYTIDACKMYVAGTNLFCGKNIGTKRMKMPQVSGRLKGDDTNGARAAKAGLVPTDWKPGKRDADGKLTELTPEEMARFSELKAKHAKTNKKGEFVAGTLTDEEKAEFYSLVDWNDTEVNFVPRMIEHLNKRRKAKGLDGDAVVSRRNVSVDELTASQAQIQAEKVTGMVAGIEENYESFVAWAESKGIKRGSEQFKKLREQWLKFELKDEIPLIDANGNRIIGDDGKPKTAFPWWMDGSIISSKDGYVVDGHHRWAAIKAVNLTLPEDEQLTVHTEEIQDGIVASLTMAKAFQDHVGIKEAKLGEEDFYVPNAEVAPMSADEFTAMLEDHDTNADERIAAVAEAGTYTPVGAVEATSPETVAEGFRFIERARTGRSPGGASVAAADSTVADRMAVASSATSRNRDVRSRVTFSETYPALARHGINPRPVAGSEDESLSRVEAERILGGASPAEIKEMNSAVSAIHERLDSDIEQAENEIISELGSREAFEALLSFEPTPEEWTSLSTEKKEKIRNLLEGIQQRQQQAESEIDQMLYERSEARRAKRNSGIAAARDIAKQRADETGTMRSQRSGRRYTSEQIGNVALDVARGVAKQIDTEKMTRDLANSWKKGGASGVMSKLRKSIREGWSSWAIGYALDEGYISKQQAKWLRAIAERLGPKKPGRRKSAYDNVSDKQEVRVTARGVVSK